ncbi:VOC family protein [Streptacidiphilus sp. PB12-B1b]|uniref:VOC family protein n=1 Tax=Streptacidiphilus sp. PB12-B1b TaxID=2705012 RepID=UPI0015FABA89|nr:VOC family protein [Streptacidiphilus sp. PB12-B1b]QMU75511.1 VOC family protein [Streptacidiphilus sp. PB12-B1b]
MELVQVRLVVRDFGECFRFYRDVLGLTPQTDDEAGPYGKFTLPGGTAAVALQQRAHLARDAPWLRGRATGGGDAALLVLKVDDLDAITAELRSRGAPLEAGPEDRWERLRVAYLRDPEGNLIELQQWTAPRQA